MLEAESPKRDVGRGEGSGFCGRRLSVTGVEEAGKGRPPGKKMNWAPGQGVKSLSLWAQPLMKGTPKCPFRHEWAPSQGGRLGWLPLGT